MPTEFNNLKNAIKQQLEKDNSNLSEQELEQQAFAIATVQFKKQGKSASENVDERLDEEGRIIVSENTKFYIGAEINVVEE